MRPRSVLCFVIGSLLLSAGFACDSAPSGGTAPSTPSGKVESPVKTPDTPATAKPAGPKIDVQ